MALPQACNGCDTIDYKGELNEAGVCGECSATTHVPDDAASAPCEDCGQTGHIEDDHDRRTDYGSIVNRSA